MHVQNWAHIFRQLLIIFEQDAACNAVAYLIYTNYLVLSAGGQDRAACMVLEQAFGT